MEERTMESRIEEAAKRKTCGYNCAQAVACTYCDIVGMNEEVMKKLNQGFALGIGGSMESTCGAIIGAINVLGMMSENPKKTMKSARNILTSFQKQNGTIICKELKGKDDGIIKRDCIDCVRDAASLLEEELSKEE